MVCLEAGSYVYNRELEQCVLSRILFSPWGRVVFGGGVGWGGVKVQQTPHENQAGV